MNPSSDSHSSGKKLSPSAEPPRRGFLYKATAVVIGATVSIAPLLAGLAVFLDPLRSRGKRGEAEGGPSDNPQDKLASEGYVRVATIDSIPDDGVPRPFPVIAERIDAWTLYPREPIGVVYLRRTAGEAKPQALTATCPHLGCFVDYNADQSIYQCPCHDSSFEPDGKRILPPPPKVCPAARDMDDLQVTVLNDSEVWVKYQKFVQVIAEQVPEA